MNKSPLIAHRHALFLRRLSLAFATLVSIILGLSYAEFRFSAAYGPLPAEAGKAAELVIERGLGLKQVIERATPRAFSPRVLHWLWAKQRLGAASVKAGVYTLEAGLKLPDLLNRMANDQGKRLEWQVLEGQSLDQVRRALAKMPYLRHESTSWSSEQLQQVLDKRIKSAPALGFLEGLLFPDTYRYVPGMSDLDLLSVACQRQIERLQSIWAQRPQDYPLQSASELLILASIVEKETAHPDDRSRVAAVFLNRLRLGMRLQSDPTVNYGMPATALGKLSRKALQTDHPYNTYTRLGLPPTPIAMPGEASLLASIRPSAEQSLYFVARGDGSSEFSLTLAQHNDAVDRFIRKRAP
ncbi:MAG: endolytic transglycosylase MltG [Betaproteobacteria bacterium]|nr:endolytic transglycosylase MltG [Betaproteobacteria bacterium]NDA34529.1 endolytic transglycosylase MltG [Betaproteobacteria bacterium]